MNNILYYYSFKYDHYEPPLSHQHPAWCCVVCCGVLWCGVVWCCVLCCGVLWPRLTWACCRLAVSWGARVWSSLGSSVAGRATGSMKGSWVSCRPPGLRFFSSSGDHRETLLRLSDPMKHKPVIRLVWSLCVNLKYQSLILIKQPPIQ